MRTPVKFMLAAAAAAAAVALFAAAFMSGCSTPLTPEERAALIGVVVRGGNVAIDRLATTHPQK